VLLMAVYDDDSLKSDPSSICVCSSPRQSQLVTIKNGNA
jgi:hypothetical protein